MKIVYNRLVPFKGFLAVNLFRVLFVRLNEDGSKPLLNRSTLNHESIHTAQMKELGYVFFYILYFIEWVIRLFVNPLNAYRSISFEREAYMNEDNPDYLKTRRHYSWIHYLWYEMEWAYNEGEGWSHVPFSWQWSLFSWWNETYIMVLKIL